LKAQSILCRDFQEALMLERDLPERDLNDQGLDHHLSPLTTPTDIII